MADQEVPAVRVYQIKVTLRDLEPPIWRRVLVRSDMTLKGLHNVLQVVMDWEGYHMHEFAIGKRRIGVPDKENFYEVENEGRIKLYQIVSRPRCKFYYIYDLGDNWEHELLVEKILPVDEGAFYPICIAGERAAPPEDCGGLWGYTEILDRLQERQTQPAESEAAIEGDEETPWWAGLDSEAFDLDKINRRLQSRFRRWQKRG